MTLKTLLPFSAALVLAAALHIVVFQPWGAPEPVMTASSGGAATARLGTSFADLVAGRVLPLSPHDTVQALQTTKRTDPEKPAPTPPVSSASENATSSAPLQPTKSPPKTQSRQRVPETAKRLEPTQSTRLATASLRPKIRPARSLAADDPKPEQPVIKRGQAAQDTIKGTTTGQFSASAQSKGHASAETNKSGSAAATNYPGVVMRYISRQRRPDIDVRGTATIAFVIASNGQLAHTKVARSSGSAALDKAALRIVERAAPFPPPPEGARLRHSVGIKGRG